MSLTKRAEQYQRTRMGATGSGLPTEPFAVSSVPTELVDSVWTDLLPMIERALSHGAGDSTTSGHVLASKKSGDMLLWVVHQGPEIIAGSVVSVKQTPAQKIVFIELCAGRDLDRWVDRIEGLLKDFRDLIGADSIQASCRAGLAKRLQKRGWGNKAFLMELE